MKLKKGSAAAKAYMAKIRAKRKTVKKVGSVAKKLSGTDKVYIEFLNKNKGFTKDKKFFATYDKALAYIRKNFDKVDPDMIKYVNGIGKAKKSVGSSLKISSKEKRLGYTNHKDTKSHNVNIRVVSGIGNIHLESLSKAIKRKEELERIYNVHKSVPVKDRSEIDKVLIKKLPQLIKNEKALIAQFKKAIK